MGEKDRHWLGNQFMKNRASFLERSEGKEIVLDRVTRKVAVTTELQLKSSGGITPFSVAS